jgi:hypothetical protein
MCCRAMLIRRDLRMATTHFAFAFVPDLAFIDNLLNSAHFAGFKTHLDAMRVEGGTGQCLLHDSARPLSLCADPVSGQCRPQAPVLCLFGFGRLYFIPYRK